MGKTVEQKAARRLETLKRRRDFLDKRINDYLGSNNSRDKAEASAINWAIGVIEANYNSAIDLIELETPQARAEEEK